MHGAGSRAGRSLIGQAHMGTCVGFLAAIDGSDSNESKTPFLCMYLYLLHTLCHHGFLTASIKPPIYSHSYPMIPQQRWVLTKQLCHCCWVQPVVMPGGQRRHSQQRVRVHRVARHLASWESMRGC